jgi:hypothetical protein
VRPSAVPPGAAFDGRLRLGGIAVEPSGDVVGVELLQPQHAGKGVPLNAPHILVRDGALHVRIEGVGLGEARTEYVVEVGERRWHWARQD